MFGAAGGGDEQEEEKEKTRQDAREDQDGENIVDRHEGERDERSSRQKLRTACSPINAAVWNIARSNQGPSLKSSTFDIGRAVLPQISNSSARCAPCAGAADPRTDGVSMTNGVGRPTAPTRPECLRCGYFSATEREARRKTAGRVWHTILINYRWMSLFSSRPVLLFDGTPADIKDRGEENKIRKLPPW